MTDLDLLEEACAPLPHTTRAMFGGHGLFAPNGGIFAATVEDAVILKFDDEAAAAEFAALGGHPWTYRDKMTMRAWLVVPEDLYDDPRALASWCARAHALAKPSAKKRKATAKPKK